MNISDVRVKIVHVEANPRLKAFCSFVVNDEIAIHDVRVIDGTSGLFVAFPDRRMKHRCSFCGIMNTINAHYCNGCGGKLEKPPDVLDRNGNIKVRLDVVHPITRDAREIIANAVLQAYSLEMDRIDPAPTYRDGMSVVCTSGMMVNDE